MTMFRHTTRLAMIALLSTTALFHISCGEDAADDNATGGADLAPSVTGSAEIRTLSAADKTTLCAEVERYTRGQIPDNRDKVCTIVASVITSQQEPPSNEWAQQSCARTRSECLDTDNHFIDDDCLEDLTTNCSATVNEYAACVRARTQQLKALFKKIRTCPDLNLNYLASDFAAEFPQLPPECGIIKTVCPGALEDGDIFDDALYADYELFGSDDSQEAETN
ncbi:hypothetical protein [Bradymonas sediminis]|nr:hypothetical protein [Bradymonas sediminis]